MSDSEVSITNVFSTSYSHQRRLFFCEACRRRFKCFQARSCVSTFCSNTCLVLWFTVTLLSVLDRSPHRAVPMTLLHSSHPFMLCSGTLLLLPPLIIFISQAFLPFPPLALLLFFFTRSVDRAVVNLTHPQILLTGFAPHWERDEWLQMLKPATY